MKEVKNITPLFLDVGGVLLTNGWVHESRNPYFGEKMIDCGETKLSLEL